MSIRKGQIIVAGAGNTRRNIGEVYYSQSSLATDNSGALPLWTGESVSTAMYPSLTEWVTKHTELQCTAEEYESALNAYGECPKYVLSTDSLRLPKKKTDERYLIDSKSPTGTDSSWYNLYSDGWLEQGGVTSSSAGSTARIVSLLKEFANTNYNLVLTSATGGAAGLQYNNFQWTAKTTENFTAKAQCSETIALEWSAEGQSTYVSDGKINFPWVVAYTSAIEASVAQAAEFQQGLSGKADTNLGNIPTNYDYVVESYQDETQWYRLYKSGWLEQGGVATEPYYSNVNTVTYLKPFEDTNYTLVVSGSRTGGYAESNMSVYDQAFNKTATGFQNYTHVNQPKNWYACGQGETPVIDDTTSGSEDTTVGDDDEFNEW